MKHQLSLYIYVLLAISHGIDAKTKSPSPKSHHAITYSIEKWRRLGDAITTVCKALYFAKACNLPVYFCDFPYFDQFALSISAPMLTSEIVKNYSKVVPITTQAELSKQLESTEPILFECQFLSETPPMYSVTREYPEFEELIKKAFTPLIDIPQLAKPPAVVTVALHVRKGGGFDKPLGSKQEYGPNHKLPKGFYIKKNSPQGSHMDAWPIKWPTGPVFLEVVKNYIYKKINYSDYIWPIKFPCDQYYIDQLKELSAMLPGKNLLIYIFTDDPEPEKIMERYSVQLKDYPRIIFSYRTKDNHHTKNVIEDLFSITQCDCLISASSSFATAAQLLGNHQVLIFPLTAITLKNKIIINKVGIITIPNMESHKNRKIGYREITN